MTYDFLPVIPENIPAELKELKQWVVWKPEKQNGKDKPKKVSYSLQKDPLTGLVTERLAAVNNPETWMSFEDALALLKKRKYKGLNFVFPSITVPGNFKKIVGVDLDHIKLSNGELNPLKINEVKALNTYAELSPSGEGLRAICFAEFPANEEVHKGDIEVYQAGKFLSITGHRLTDVPCTVNSAQDAITAFRAKYFKIAEELEEAALPITTTKFSDDDIIAFLANSKSAEIADSFRKMFYDGDIKTANGTEDHSAADFNLCKLIIFWTQDPEQIDRIFRQSKLIRNKWDENHGYANGQAVTYGQKTINNALRTRKTVYRGAAERSKSTSNNNLCTSGNTPGLINIEIYPYTIRNDGIYKTELSKGMPKTFHEVQISPTPCQIIAIGDNIDTGEILYKLCILDAKNREKVCWKSGKDLLTRTGALSLIDDGMIFTEPNVGNIENLFDVYINEILGTSIPEEVTVSKSGWKLKGDLFVIGNTGYRKDGVTQILQLGNNTSELYAQQGDLSEWKKAADELLKFNAIRFKMYAACTPLILPIIGVHSFLQEQYGPSGLLKTLSSWFCASVFGNPETLQLTARSTPKGIEAFVGFNTDLPVFIDETSNADKEIKELIYLIANGTGRSTSNKNRGYEMPKTWSTVVLTTGEHPILPTNAKTGEAVRDVPLKGGVSEKLDQNLVNNIETILRENYGLLRELLLKEIFKNKSELKAIYKEFYAALPNSEKETTTDARAKKFYAAMATAGWILENVFGDMGIKQEDPVKTVEEFYIKNVITDGADSVFVPDHVRAFEAFQSWFASNRIYFVEESEDEEESSNSINHERYGWVKSNTIHITPTRLEKVLTDLGYNFRGCLEEWRKDEKYLGRRIHKKGEKETLEYRFTLTEKGAEYKVFRIPFSRETPTLEEYDNTQERDIKYRKPRNHGMTTENMQLTEYGEVLKEKEEKFQSLVVTPDEMADFLLEEDFKDKESIIISEDEAVNMLLREGY